MKNKNEVGRWFQKLGAMVLALAVTASLWLGYVAARPDLLTDSIAATMRYKVQLLQDTAGTPRIIFVGGSSSPYGTDCAAVEDALGMPAIDIGATAYLGLPFYFKTLEKYAAPGDVIVLAPEHMMLAGDCVDYSLVWQAAGTDRAVWQCVPISYYPNLFRTSRQYLKQKNAAIAAGRTDVAAYAAGFGPRGDVIETRETQLASGWNTEDPVSLSQDAFDAEKIAEINRFAAHMKEKGVQVYFAYAPLDALCIETDEAAVDAYAKSLEKNLEVPVILSQQQAILPGTLFYDSNNHLTTEGAALNTENLIAGLRAQGVGSKKP